MWILPKQLHTSDFVPDTAALSLDCTELSEICARLLFVRSKPSPARTWSQKWKRDSWTQHLSGRILNHSHGQSFVTAWTSSLGAIPASPSAQPESASAPMTLATSGHLSQTEFGFCDPSSASLRMSKDTSALDSEKSLESWNQSVTKRRGEYSARLKSGHRTSASGSSSWPTISVNESKNSVGKSQLSRNSIPLGTMAMMIAESHASFAATNSTTNCLENTDAQTARVKDAANWPTPQSGDVTGSTQEAVVMWANGKRPKTSDQRLRTKVAAEQLKYGQAAPANPSTDGSRQELWPTATVPNGGQTTSGRADKASKRQVRLEHAVSDWPTITAHTPDMESGGPNGNSGTYLAGAVKQWATPRAGKTTDENPETWAAKQAKGDVATMPLTAQVKCWGTPTARDQKSGRGNKEREYKELTPMVERTQTGKLNPRWVETLMGLPVGWVMPSCKSPVTIEPTNCDCSATESCLPQQSELLEF